MYRRVGEDGVGEDGVGGISSPPPLLTPQPTGDHHGLQEADACLLTIPRCLQPPPIIHLVDNVADLGVGEGHLLTGK